MDRPFLGPKKGHFWVICRLNRETCWLLKRRENYFFFIPKAGKCQKKCYPSRFFSVFSIFFHFFKNWCFLAPLRSLGLSVWTSENSPFLKISFLEVENTQKTQKCTFLKTCLPRAPALDFSFWTKKSKSGFPSFKSTILFWAKNAYAFTLSQECLLKRAR